MRLNQAHFLINVKYFCQLSEQLTCRPIRMEVFTVKTFLEHRGETSQEAAEDPQYLNVFCRAFFTLMFEMFRFSCKAKGVSAHAICA